MAKFFIVVCNREYKGIPGYYTASPICVEKSDAVKFLRREYDKLNDEFKFIENEWDKEETQENFYITNNHNYDLWGWIEEIETDSKFVPRTAYVLYATQHVDGIEDNDELETRIVFTDGGQHNRDKVYQEIDKLIERFKEENNYPDADWGDTGEERMFENWGREIGFDTDEISGELTLWFESHDII